MLTLFRDSNIIGIVEKMKIPYWGKERKKHGK